MPDPIDTDAARDHSYTLTEAVDTIRAFCDEVDRLRAKVAEALDWAERHQAERDRLRSLLAQALDWIDPNDDQAALELWRSCQEAVDG